MKGRTKKNDTEKIYWRNAERKKSNAGTRYKKCGRRSDRERGDSYNHGGCARKRADNLPIMAQKLVEANCPYLKVGVRVPNLNIDDSQEQLRFA